MRMDSSVLLLATPAIGPTWMVSPPGLFALLSEVPEPPPADDDDAALPRPGPGSGVALASRLSALPAEPAADPAPVLPLPTVRRAPWGPRGAPFGPSIRVGVPFSS